MFAGRKRGGDRVNDRRRRRLIGIPHAEVDEIGAAAAGVGLECIEPRKDVLRQIGQPPAGGQLAGIALFDVGEFAGFGNGSHRIRVEAGSAPNSFAFETFSRRRAPQVEALVVLRRAGVELGYPLRSTIRRLSIYRTVGGSLTSGC